MTRLCRWVIIHLFVRQDGLVLCLNSDLDRSENALVALYLALELTKLLDFWNSDVLLLDLDACCAEDLSDLGCGNGTIKLSAFTNLGSDLELYCADLLSESLCICNDLSLFVSALTDGLLVLLDS